VFMITYTMGTLANNFEDKDTCYVYLCTISPELRRSKLFLIGLLLAFNDISHLDFSTILFKGYEGYEYTTKLYMKLAQIIETAKNHQGLDCHLFSTTKEHLEFYFKRYISRLKLEF